MSLEKVFDVCRLCSRNENLLWIFNTQFESTEEKLKDTIFINTGVEVSKLKPFYHKIILS